MEYVNVIPVSIVGKMPDEKEAQRISAMPFRKIKISGQAAYRKIGVTFFFFLLSLFLLPYSVQWFQKADESIANSIVAYGMVLFFVICTISLIVKAIKVYTDPGTSNDLKSAVDKYWNEAVFRSMNYNDITNNVLSSALPCETIRRMSPEGYDFDYTAFMKFCTDLFFRLYTKIAPEAAYNHPNGRFQRVKATCTINSTEEVKPNVFKVDGLLETIYTVRPTQRARRNAVNLPYSLANIAFTQYYIRVGKNYVPYDPSPTLYVQSFTQ